MSNGNTAIPVSPVVDIIAALHAGEAAKAKVPELEAAVDDLSKKCDMAQYHNQRLEENIIEYKNQISGLISKVRSLEVERDDAGFHALEAEDKLAKLLGFMRNAATAMDDEIRFIDPPKPVPNVAEAPKADEVKGQSEGGPTASSGGEGQSQSAPISPVAIEANASPSIDKAYQPFTPPNPSTKPVEITEGSQSNEHPSTGQSSTNEPWYR